MHFWPALPVLSWRRFLPIRSSRLAVAPAAKAIFLLHFPEVVNHPQFNEGLDLTLPEVVQYLPDVVTPEKLASMDAELKALPQ